MQKQPVFAATDMHPYQTQYSALGFERAGLFRAILHRDKCRDVLYPGYSIHITPSLYFPHAVFVDKEDREARFYANQKPLLEYVNQRKQYKQSTYIRFIEQDYREPLPVLDATFDLVLVSAFSSIRI